MDFLNVPNNFSMAGNVNLQALPLTNKRPLQTQPPAKTQVHPPSKPQMQQRYKALAQPVKKPQPISKPQMQPPSKSQESFENVRSKLRESLGAALALVGQMKNTQQPDEGKSSQREAASQVKIEVPANQEAATVAMQSSAEPQAAESTMAIVDSSCPMTENPVQACMSNNSEFCQSVNEVHNSLVGNSVDEKLEFAKMWSYDQVFNPSDIFPEEETSFIVKDDLLQGNGLCWASDLDLDNFVINDMRDPKKPKLMQEVPDVQIENSPQTLAAKIEDELFKLFGGVNKKYKEKGRSLLFNLKDPSNPELRERVMSGEISPERLSSMTAEELASKELSEWRIAKAEELAQMVVLPDSEVDFRRVVKKTHKGEFQVEFEQDDGASVEVAIGQSSLITMPSRTSGIEGERTDETKTKMTGKTESDGDNLLTLTHDNTDFMQGLMVDDELKDTEFLPPIVSLDEFMESLDNEPPFENLPTNGAEKTTSDKGKSESTGVVMDGANSRVKDSVGASPKEKQAKAATKSKKAGNDMKSDESKVESKVLHFVDESKGEKIWSGILQLSISSVVTVLGFFKSGEKTSTKEWPSLLEIKGRVRPDAFGKFLQELPQSRSRAIMIVEFCWQEGSSESGQSKVVDSYVADERVGLAEPAPGVELYVCPPHCKTSELLSGLLPKDHAEAVKTIDSGLIGIVVWRRAVSTVISPRTSSLHRQNSRKHPSPSQKKQQQEKSPTVRPPPIQTQSAPMNNDPLSDDDVPPGFGPGAGRAARDDDDLPEFEFGQTMNHTPSTPAGSAREVSGRARPVEQVRDLIHKYGQSKTTSSPVNWGPHGSRGAGIEIQPWNDDDDIPDWQPGLDSRQQSHPLPAAPPQTPLPVAQYPAGHPYKHHTVYSHIASTAQPPQLGLQHPVNFHSQVAHVPGQHANWSAPAYASGGVAGAGQAQQLGYFGGHRTDGQYYRMPGQNGMDWRAGHQ